MSESLHLWVIYDSPADYPGLYVVREWCLVDGKAVGLGAWFSNSLRRVRAKVPKGLACLPRDPSDPPCVVETWL